MKICDYYVCFAYWRRTDNYQGLEWFLDHVYSKLNGLKIKIIGAGLNERLRMKILAFNNIEYVGFVDNPYPFISNATGLISPLFTGAGIKVKVIDALACGTPVIGTDISFEGIDEKYAEFCVRANTADDFIENISLLEKYSKVERLAFKNEFIRTYSDREIIKFINHR